MLSSGDMQFRPPDLYLFQGTICHLTQKEINRPLSFWIRRILTLCPQNEATIYSRKV